MDIGSEKRTLWNVRCLYWGWLSLSIIFVFWKALFFGTTLFTPDAAPYFIDSFSESVFRNFYGVTLRAFYPQRLMAVLLPPFVYHVARYIVDVILVAFAALYFLRGRGLKGLPVYVASIAMAFSGYFFTLVSAGHYHIFDMMPYAILLLACVDRAIERESFFHYALAAACVAFGVNNQPDIMGLFCVLAGAYGLHRITTEWIQRPEGRKRLLGRTGVGLAVAVVALIGFGLGTFAYVRTEVVPARTGEIEQTTDRSAKDLARENYEFATNWSMPPEEILEFVAPCVYGIETGDRRAPYWGRLGRSKGWKPGQAGLMNLKQHTLYLGVLQLLFAAYAVACVVRRRNRSRLFEAPGLCRDVWFWTGVFALTVLLAMGRYTPFYRLFYHLPLPFVSKIRCPVKFIHLTEVATMFLFAVGFSASISDAAMVLASRTQALRAKTGRKDKRHSERAVVSAAVDSASVSEGTRKRLTFFAIMALTCGVVLLVAASISQNMFVGYWNWLGLGRYTAEMRGALSAGLAHGGGLFLVGAVFFALPRFGLLRGRTLSVVCVAIALVVTVDLVTLGRKYISVRDVTPIYSDNPIAELIKRQPGQWRTSLHLSPNSWRAWPASNFKQKDVAITQPAADGVKDTEYLSFLRAVGKDPIRLWQLTNTRFIVGPTQSMRQLIAHPDFKVIAYFNYSGGVIRKSDSVRGEAVLLEFKHALPRALLYYDWRSTDNKDALGAIAAAEFNPWKTVVVSDVDDQHRSELASDMVNVVAHYRDGLAMNTVIDVDAREEGVLLVNDPYDGGVRVTVDGKRQSLLRCNYRMQGVHVPAGKHRVVFGYREHMFEFGLTVACFMGLVLWGCLRVVRQKSAPLK